MTLPRFLYLANGRFACTQTEPERQGFAGMTGSS